MNSNRTPFTDVCELVTVEKKPDADGYKTPTEQKKEIFCSVNTGVVRSEFYAAYKAGVRLDVTVELWEQDYDGQRLMDYTGKRYDVVRAYPTGHGTLELTCSEVVR